MNRTTTHYTLIVPTNGFLSGVNLIVRISLSMIDKKGRRHLVLIGYLVSPLVMGYGFFGHASPAFNLIGIITFIIAHAVGQGRVIRLFVSEILPNKQRTKAQSFGAGIHWGASSGDYAVRNEHDPPTTAMEDFLHFFILYDFTAADCALQYASHQGQTTRMCSERIYYNLNSI